MKLKDNTINPRGMKIETLLAMTIASMVYQKFGYTMRITSITDYHHSATYSDHYKGNAFDVGTSELKESDKQKVFDEITERLNNQYQILFEGAGTSSEHIHISYKPTYQGR